MHALFALCPTLTSIYPKYPSSAGVQYLVTIARPVHVACLHQSAIISIEDLYSFRDLWHVMDVVLWHATLPMTVQ